MNAFKKYWEYSNYSWNLVSVTDRVWVSPWVIVRAYGQVFGYGLGMGKVG